MVKQTGKIISPTEEEIRPERIAYAEAQHTANGSYDEEQSIKLQKKERNFLEKLKGLIYKEGTYNEITPPASDRIEKRIDDMIKVQKLIADSQGATK